MISYQNTLEDFDDLSRDFGIVVYGFHARSLELLNEIHDIYRDLLKEYLEVFESLIRLNSKILGRYNLSYIKSFYYLKCFSVIEAVNEGNVDFFRSLYNGYRNIYCGNDNYLMLSAILQGKLEIFRSLRDGSLGNIHPWNESLIHYAAERGLLDVIRSLRDGSLGEKYPWDKNYYRKYAENRPELLALIDSGELD